MGMTKRLLEEEWARGYYSIGDKYVCRKCIDERAIQSFIKEYAEKKDCDYCGSRSSRNIAAPVDKVMGFIMGGIRSEWGDPNNEGVPWESREGGWQGTVLDSYDLLRDEIELPIENEELWDDIIQSIFDKEWCRKNYWGMRKQDALFSSWERFVKQVLHVTRYVFFRFLTEKSLLDSTELIEPSDMMDEIAQIINETGLIRTIKTGTIFRRVRIHGLDKFFSTATELGPPPAELARFSNRMSPAGIPAFYGALKSKTAILETYSKDDRPRIATIATFRTLKNLLVLDLTRIPEFPSLFDEQRRHLRPLILFLRNFAEAISQPVFKNDREQIEYVPTQIMTEYFRHLYKTESDEAIKGILYPSSQHPNNVACVLFLENEHCCDAGSSPSENDKWLELQKYFRKKLKPLYSPD